jgi:hypothetical protein
VFELKQILRETVNPSHLEDIGVRCCDTQQTCFVASSLLSGLFLLSPTVSPALILLIVSLTCFPASIRPSPFHIPVRYRSQYRSLHPHSKTACNNITTTMHLCSCSHYLIIQGRMAALEPLLLSGVVFTSSLCSSKLSQAL